MFPRTKTRTWVLDQSFPIDITLAVPLGALPPVHSHCLLIALRLYHLFPGWLLPLFLLSIFCFTSIHESLAWRPWCVPFAHWIKHKCLSLACKSSQHAPRMPLLLKRFRWRSLDMGKRNRLWIDETNRQKGWGGEKGFWRTRLNFSGKPNFEKGKREDSFTGALLLGWRNYNYVCFFVTQLKIQIPGREHVIGLQRLCVCLGARHWS